MTPEVRAFLEGKQFIHTDENILLLRQWFTEHNVPQTSETSAVCLYELSQAGHAVLEYTPKAAAKIAQAAQAAEAQRIANDPILKEARETKAREDAAAAENALFASWWVPLQGENSMQTLQRATALKEDYMRRKYPRAVPSQTPAASTIRNTNQSLKMEQARAERQRQSLNQK